ncbi:hypothetical protein ACROYT_G044240 [Oculina patagonica]
MAEEFDTTSNESWVYSDEEPESYSESLPAHAIFQLILFTAIFVVGFFGNSIVIYGVLQQGSSKTTSSCFIANLALSDLAVLVLSLPVGLLQELASWPFGEMACKIFFPLGDVFLAVSIMTLTAIALDRYRAIVTPFKERFSKTQAKVCIALIWIFSYLVVGIPTSFILKLVNTNGVKVCYPFWNNDLQRQIHKILIASISTLPLFVIGYCYFRVVMALWKVRMIYRDTTKNSVTTIRLEQKRKLVKMLIVIVIAFSICLLPYIIFALALEFAGVERSPSVNVGLVAVLSLLYLNSAINPLILCTMSKDYRKGLRPCGC